MEILRAGVGLVCSSGIVTLNEKKERARRLGRG
jgi:hypothetical protein